MKKYQKWSFLLQKWAKKKQFEEISKHLHFRPQKLVLGPTAKGVAPDKNFFTHELPLGGRFKPTWELEFEYFETDTDI